MIACERPITGLVGGMGPLASADFVRSVYERTCRAPEQDAPRLVLWSDPTVPDRTTLIEEEDLPTVAAHLSASVGALRDLGATQVVILCLTAHAALHLLEPARREVVRSLVDIVVAEVEAADTRTLLLATNGFLTAGVLQRHPRWPALRDRVVVPSAEDQHVVHGALYDLKAGADRVRVAQVVHDLVAGYAVGAVAAACTELHLLTRDLADPRRACGRQWIDPLTVLADEIAGVRR